ncbi:MAG: hypothetical protein ABR577_17900 [Pyrinomonadaceae bacterium]
MHCAASLVVFAVARQAFFARLHLPWQDSTAALTEELKGIWNTKVIAKAKAATK